MLATTFAKAIVYWEPVSPFWGMTRNRCAPFYCTLIDFTVFIDFVNFIDYS